MSGIKIHIDILIDYLNLENMKMLHAKGYGYTWVTRKDTYNKEVYKLGNEI